MPTIAKFLMALLFAALTALSPLITLGELNAEQWVQVAIAGATAAGVWVAANTPALEWAKTLIAVVLGVLQVLVATILDGLSQADIVNLVLAALTVLSVYFTPNAPTARALPA